MAVMLLLPSGFDEGSEVVVIEGIEVALLARIFPTEPDALLNVLLPDVDARGDTFAVMDDVPDVIKDTIGDDVLSDKDVTGDAVSTIDNAAKELMTGATMVLLPVPQLQVSSSSQQNRSVP